MKRTGREQLEPDWKPVMSDADDRLLSTHKRCLSPPNSIVVDCADDPMDSLLITRRDNMWCLRVINSDSGVYGVTIKDDTMAVILRIIGEEMTRKG